MYELIYDDEGLDVTDRSMSMIIQTPTSGALLKSPILADQKTSLRTHDAKLLTDTLALVVIALNKLQMVPD